MANFNITEANLEDFTPVTLLGEGAYGRVILMKANEEPDKSYAIKLIKKDSENESYTRHLAEEVNICCKLKNRFCIEIHRVFDAPSHYGILMEACLGGDLWKLLDDHTYLSVDLTRFITASLLQALHYLHTNGIIYRDIKSENVLIAANGYVKLADFGLSKNIALEGKTNTLCGTPTYIAPEVILKEPYGFGVDYWALGTLLFEMLVGKNPFDAPNYSVTLKKILEGFESVIFPNGFPQDARDLVMKLCHTEPEKRLQFSKETGVGHIEAYKFFEGFNFDALRTGSMPAPYVPSLNGPYDTSRF